MTHDPHHANVSPENSQTVLPSTARSKPPGLKEIAAYLNLSPATVSMVINDVPLARSLSEETRARVQAAVKHFNYRPNLIARALCKRETRTIGVIAPESSDGYFTRVMRGIERAMLNAGYLYFTASHLGRTDLQREYPNALTQRGVDGLIFVNTRMFEHPGVPTVCISDRSEIADVTSVLVDQRDGMFRAMEHLAALGHKRIVVMRGSEWSLDGHDRFQAMQAAAHRLNIPLCPDLTIALETNQLSPDVAYRAMLRQVELTRDFTAVFAFNDVAAVGAMRALADCGMRCPEDVSVLGVDDNSNAAYGIPRLSTSAQPLEDMGEAAAACLIARIQHPQQPQPPRIVFPMTLHIRESTAAPRPSPVSQKQRVRASRPAELMMGLLPSAPAPPVS